jgi:hypothetical protein
MAAVWQDRPCPAYKQARRIPLICPKCQTVFPAGQSNCPSCGAASDDLPDDALDAGDVLVELLRTPDIAQLVVIKSLLESSGIPFMVIGEEGLRTFPLSMAGGFFNPSALGATIRVRRQDLAAARQLLEESAAPPEDGSEP